MTGKILILDDDRKVIDLISLVLRREGHNVEGVTSYEGALASLKKRPVDLLVSDLNMPGVGGIEGIQNLSRKKLVQRALVVSGYIDADAQAQIASTPEIVGYLEKPFDIHELARLVRRHVELPSAQSSAAGE